MDLLEPTGRRGFCEFKGQARYFTLRVSGRAGENAAWAYPSPLGKPGTEGW